MNGNVRLVTCTHASNILGTIHDIKSIAEEVHRWEGAMLCVDGVAYAPHREVDVKDLDADFYSFSLYKTYGPHIAVLYASAYAQSSLTSLGHYFHNPDTLNMKLGLAAASYELVSSIPSILSYFGPSSASRRATWTAIAAHEEHLQSILLKYLNGRDDVTVYGLEDGNKELRVPVVSFSVKGKESKDIVEKVDAMSDMGIRWGHFYSKRLVDDVLGQEGEGVVRVSMVHYNTGTFQSRASFLIVDCVGEEDGWLTLSMQNKRFTIFSMCSIGCSARISISRILDNIQRSCSNIVSPRSSTFYGRVGMLGT
ncbi:MAG: hypothetical protein Q9183_004171 [Haloplaca sp. 2 TL-2023]